MTTDQDKYYFMLKKIIDDTDSSKIIDAQEVIKILVKDLKSHQASKDAQLVR